MDDIVPAATGLGAFRFALGGGLHLFSSLPFRRLYRALGFPSIVATVQGPARAPARDQGFPRRFRPAPPI